MQLTNTLLLTLSATTLTLASPQIGATPELGVAKEFPASDLDFLDFAIPDSPTVAATVDPTTAAAVNNNTTQNARRFAAKVEPRRMRYCQHANAKGECRNIEFPDMKCVNLEQRWDNRISSAYVNGDWWCEWHLDRNCKGRRTTMMHPGIGNFKNVGMNDAVSSFFCYRGMY